MLQTLLNFFGYHGRVKTSNIHFSNHLILGTSEYSLGPLIKGDYFPLVIGGDYTVNGMVNELAFKFVPLANLLCRFLNLPPCLQPLFGPF